MIKSLTFSRADNPCRLEITDIFPGTITALLASGVGSTYRGHAYASAKLDECVARTYPNSAPELYLSPRICFELSPEELAEVREMFPGLKIEEVTA